MATKLERRIERATSARVFDRGMRELTIILEPPATIGIRAKGTRDVYRIDAEMLFSIAVKYHEQQIEKRAKELKKTGLRIGTARSKARRELKRGLKA